MTGSRLFNGTSDDIRVDPTGAGVTAAATYLLVVKPTANDGSVTYISRGTPNYNPTWGNAADSFFSCGSLESYGAPNCVPKNGSWQVIAVTKAAGKVLARGHRVPLPAGSGKPAHENYSSKVADRTLFSPMIIGSDGDHGGYDFNGKIALLAIWSKALTDEQIASCTGLAAIEALAPNLLVPLDGEPPFEKQTAINGTTHSEDDPWGPWGPWEGTSLEEFVQQEKEEDRIMGSGLKCPGTTHDFTVRFENKTGDSLSKVEEEEEPPVTRAEIYTEASFACATEVTRWYRWQTRFGDDYDTGNLEKFRTITQFKQTDEARAIFGLYTNGPDIRLNSFIGPIVAKITKGIWYDWTLEAVWSETKGTALQRLYLNGKLVAEVTDRLLPEGIGVYLKWGYYKDASIPSGTIYHGGFVSAEVKAELGPPVGPLVRASEKWERRRCRPKSGGVFV